jgi:hypothetical protein
MRAALFARPIRLSFLCSLLLLACSQGSSPDPKSSRQDSQPFRSGFWFWERGSLSAASSMDALELLYLQVGTIRQLTHYQSSRWYVDSTLPERLPPAKEYWIVFRLEGQSVPNLESLPNLQNAVARALIQARERKLQISGIQLDIDSPTNSLSVYADFLRACKKGLPSHLQLSITALLDWFRPGTAIATVLREVDEFVPQFYDVEDRRYDSTPETMVAAPIDGARWGPIFNSYRKRYRIGVSSFGRSTFRPPSHGDKSNGLNRLYSFADITPMQLATNPAFVPSSTRTKANELLVRYQAIRNTALNYNSFEAGSAIEFLFPTPESIASAAKQVRMMGGYCAGMLFFRWPSFNEVLSAHPAMVLSAAGIPNQPVPKPSLYVKAGHCATVFCVDLYLINSSPLSPTPLEYTIEGSADLDYFLPAEKAPIRMTGPRRLTLRLPPYSGAPRLSLGRAVASEKLIFTLEAKPAGASQ